ncbi:MAG: preprotein translocase subunit YajC, partial [Clostridia bacterium]|nr:preprotein translocase subunit YajC [Clostridia bacterium]
MIGLLAGDFFSDYGVMLIFIVIMMVVMFVLPNSARKKQYQQLQDFLSNLKVGDKVKTTSGFYGTIVSMRETTDGRVALLEMGEGDKKGYIEVDMNAIYMIDAKENVVYDADGNIIESNKKEGPTTNKSVQNNESEIADAEITDADAITEFYMLTTDIVNFISMGNDGFQERVFGDVPEKNAQEAYNAFADDLQM